MKTAVTSSKICITILPCLVCLGFKCAKYNKQKETGINPKNQLSLILTEKKYNELFPLRNTFYTYSAFIKAAEELACIRIKVIRRAVSVYQLTRTDVRTGKSVIVRQDPDWNEEWAKKKPDSTFTINYGDFCSEKDVTTNKKELAAFFAQVAHETRNGENGKYNDGLMAIHENDTTLSYIAENDTYPPVAGKKYYGRGPMQLSYNGNYGYASDCIFGDKRMLLNNPGLIETNPVISFETAIYFWMTPQTAKPSAHDVMIGKWQPNTADKAAGRTPGFGMTTNIINGEIECGKGENLYNMNDRIGFYRHFLMMMGLSDPDCACSCGKMKPY